MNDWNPWERRLRSWKPRTPSAKLRERLFAGTETAWPVEPVGTLAVKWAWLAPAMCCFLAMMVVTGSRSSQLGYWSAGRTTNWLAAVARNQGYAAYIVADFHSEQNALQQDPIRWTNGSTPLEPTSVSFPRTNSLIR